MAKNELPKICNFHTIFRHLLRANHIIVIVDHGGW